jgi:hypothetical protein
MLILCLSKAQIKTRYSKQKQKTKVLKTQFAYSKEVGYGGST